MTIRALALGMIFITALNGKAFAAEIDVLEGGIITRVLFGSDSDTKTTSLPINPLAITHHAQLGLNQATTEVDLTWGRTGGSFEFLINHVIYDTPGFPDVSTFGGVVFTSNVDAWLDYHYIYSFDNLGGSIILQSTNTIAQAVDDGGEFLERSVRQAGTGALLPSSGAFITTRHLLLEANEIYGISYSVFMTGGEDTGVIGIGSGSLSFTLTPVPEPVSALLLIVPVALIRRPVP